MKVKLLMLVCLLMAVLMAVGCAATKAPKVAEARVPAGYEMLRLVGTTLGSRWTTVVAVYSALLSKYYPEIQWSSSSGAVTTNTIYLQKGEYKLAATNPASYVDAYGFDATPQSRLRSISLGGPSTSFFWAVPEDKPWKSIGDVPKGSTLVPGAPGTTLPIIGEAWLRLAGLSKEDFRWTPVPRDDMTQGWRVGKFDVLMLNVAGMAPWLMDLYTSPRKFKIFGMTPEEVAKAKAEQTFERLGYDGVYMSKVTKIVPEVFRYDVIAVEAATVLASRDDFPEEIAYRIAKIIDERRDEAIQRFAALKFGLPEDHIGLDKPPLRIHPGVAKYYKEKGYLK